MMWLQTTSCCLVMVAVAAAAVLAHQRRSREDKHLVLRLRPGTEIKSALSELNLNGGVVSCVGSTIRAVIRLANAAPGVSLQDSSLKIDKPMEILSLSGTLTRDGLHLHVSLGDELGNVVGGHLVSAVVHTTCELVILQLAQPMKRVFDADTGFSELEPCGN
ncbi:hypothetical protein BASA81_005830 [Batrachochytrium salamandrivorans]|nr:hypothetical protein BASA81_005830 [Batrachochytrium salamandrivorans]